MVEFPTGESRTFEGLESSLGDVIPIRSDYGAICMTSVPIRHSGEGRNPESPISKNAAASHRIGITYET